eukprot:TRINITY_DN105108_c0_g1_i1.p1 TRINITY_DN105108_c0_g1~~TRINITY_DN105108_c0_g1_i1.p1  ORF type:complete len:182 (+),score=1.39 TRINITY_DN105108_c0_g1_i1:88-633(+)
MDSKAYDGIQEHWDLIKELENEDSAMEMGGCCRVLIEFDLTQYKTYDEPTQVNLMAYLSERLQLGPLHWITTPGHLRTNDRKRADAFRISKPTWKVWEYLKGAKVPTGSATLMEGLTICSVLLWDSGRSIQASLMEWTVAPPTNGDIRQWSLFDWWSTNAQNLGSHWVTESDWQRDLADLL